MEEANRKPVSSTLKAKLHDCLIAAHGKDSSVRYTVLTSSDGFVIAETLDKNSGLDAKRLSAMSASFAGISDSLGAECGMKGVKGGVVESDNGLIVCRSIRSESMETALLVVFDQSVNHGIAFWTLNSISKSVTEVLNAYD